MQGLILFCFVLLSALISLEDISRKEVSAPLLFIYLLFCAVSFAFALRARGFEALGPFLRSCFPVVLFLGLFLLNKTGAGDLFYLLGLAFLTPDFLEMKGISFLVPLSQPLLLTAADVAVVNSFSMLLRKEALQRSVLRRDAALAALSLLPLIWPLALVDARNQWPKRTIPLIPYLQLGVLIGVFLNQLLI